MRDPSSVGNIFSVTPSIDESEEEEDDDDDEDGMVSPSESRLPPPLPLLLPPAQDPSEYDLPARSLGLRTLRRTTPRAVPT